MAEMPDFISVSPPVYHRFSVVSKRLSLKLELQNIILLTSDEKYVLIRCGEEISIQRNSTQKLLGGKYAKNGFHC
jgi:hypothetical protein